MIEKKLNNGTVVKLGRIEYNGDKPFFDGKPCNVGDRFEICVHDGSGGIALKNVALNVSPLGFYYLGDYRYIPADAMPCRKV